MNEGNPTESGTEPRVLASSIFTVNLAEDTLVKIAYVAPRFVDFFGQMEVVKKPCHIINSAVLNDFETNDAVVSYEPSLDLSDDESRDIKELEYRLALYKLIKEASHGIGRLNLPMLYEGRPQELEPLYIPDPSVTATSLRGAAKTLIDGFPATLALPKVEVKKIISLEEMINTMAARISQAFKMSFREFSGKKERGEIIVSFLALLELVKQGILKAEQEAHFGDITLESDSVSTPNYGR